MPYYCTVPRCTSMAGKAKNVSFHQFPRDEDLARLWNEILKRGKPYTKYSKVCSLHFKPEDYTITSVGKNKGQWRTLRKDAVPSQNLPSETPAPYTRKQWDSWSPGSAPVMDPSLQHQMAQAIYMQTMMAMQAAGTEPPVHQNGPKPELPNTSYHEDIKLKQNECTYRCTDCSKCFKDPDVFILHKRTHTKDTEKENFNVNLTLRSNPILANLLKTDNLDPNVVSMENLIMRAIAANMDYLKNYANIKEENFDGYDNRREEYENREVINSDRQRNDEDREDRNRNSFNQDSVNRSYRNDCRSNSDAVYDLNRLKSDLNRRSVEIHVRSDLSQANNDHVTVKNDLALPKANANENTERVSDKSYMERQNSSENHNSDANRSENNSERVNHSENHNIDANRSENNSERVNHSENYRNEQESNINCEVDRVNRFAMNFTSQELNQIPYKASFYRESYLPKNALKPGEDTLLEPICSLQYESFSSNDGKFSKSVLSNSSSCDNDLNESLDSNSLVIDESV